MAKEIADGITIDSDVMAAKPVIKGTRMPVELVLAKLAANPNIDELLADYPHLTVDQVRACLRYATTLVQKKERATRAKAAVSGPAAATARRSC